MKAKAKVKKQVQPKNNPLWYMLISILKLVTFQTITTRGFKVPQTHPLTNYIETKPTIDDKGFAHYIKGPLNVYTNHIMGLYAMVLRAAGYGVGLTNKCQTLTISITSKSTGKVLATVWQNTIKGSMFTIFANCLTTNIEHWALHVPNLTNLMPLSVINYTQGQKPKGLVSDTFYASHTGAMQVDFERPITPPQLLKIVNYLEHGKHDTSQNPN